MAERVFYKVENIDELVGIYIKASEKARREGLLALDDDIAELSSAKGYHYLIADLLQLVLDGVDLDTIQGVGEAARRRIMDDIRFGWVVWLELLAIARARDDADRAIKDFLDRVYIFESGAFRGQIDAFVEFAVAAPSLRAGGGIEATDAALPPTFRLHPLTRATVLVSLDEAMGEEPRRRTLEAQFSHYCQALERNLAVMVEGTIQVQRGNNPKIVERSLREITGGKS